MESPSRFFFFFFFSALRRLRKFLRGRSPVHHEIKLCSRKVLEQN